MRGKKRKLIHQATAEALGERILRDMATPRPKRPWWRRLVDWLLRRHETVPAYSPRKTLRRLKRTYRRLPREKRAVKRA